MTRESSTQNIDRNQKVKVGRTAGKVDDEKS